MKIGIFGGAFNPVHNGHMHLANAYYNELKLDKLIFIPTAKPPHKTSEHFVSSDDRINMLSLAIGEKPYEISTIELERNEVSYTYDTLILLKKEYPDDKLFLIVGSDQFFYFDKWYRYREILNMVTLCTLARENDEERKKIVEYAKKLGIDKDFCLLNTPVLKVDSTEIRNSIKTGEDVSSLLPNGVLEYIKEKGLYSV